MKCNEIIYGSLLPSHPLAGSGTPSLVWGWEKYVKLALWPHQLLLVPFHLHPLSHLVLSSGMFSSTLFLCFQSLSLPCPHLLTPRFYHLGKEPHVPCVMSTNILPETSKHSDANAGGFGHVWDELLPSCAPQAHPGFGRKQTAVWLLQM